MAGKGDEGSEEERAEDNEEDVVAVAARVVVLLVVEEGGVRSWKKQWFLFLVFLHVVMKKVAKSEGKCCEVNQKSSGICDIGLRFYMDKFLAPTVWNSG